MSSFNWFILVFSKSKIFGLFSALFLFLHFFSQAQLVTVWEDNFNGNSIDPANWTYDVGDGCPNCGWGNSELQYYRSQNVRVENGNLIIEAKSENFGGKSFTSGRIKTLGHVHFKYGTLEARIKIPNLKNGLWPAFWTMGISGNWPQCGEIDGMEAGGASSYPDSVNNGVTAASHWEYMDAPADYAKTYKNPVALSDDYHIYKIVWSPISIKAYIDNIEYFVIDISGGAALDLEEFHNPHYILLNLAVGGAFPNITSPPGITAPMPAQMFVDYVRLTQAVLPVKLLAFSVSIKENKNVVISWTATNEENADYYIIERSTDGSSFNKIEIVTSKGSIHENSYLYSDTSPFEGVSYYRLVQVDKDGNKTISNIRSVKFSKRNIELLTIFPNPSLGGRLTLLFSHPGSKKLNIQIIDALGKILVNVYAKPNGNVLEIKLRENLATGIYLVKIDGVSGVEKFVIE